VCVTKKEILTSSAIDIFEYLTKIVSLILMWHQLQVDDLAITSTMR